MPHERVEDQAPHTHATDVLGDHERPNLRYRCAQRRQLGARDHYAVGVADNEPRDAVFDLLACARQQMVGGDVIGNELVDLLHVGGFGPAQLDGVRTASTMQGGVGR